MRNLRIFTMSRELREHLNPDTLTMHLKAAGFVFDKDTCPVKIREPWDRSNQPDGSVLWRQWDADEAPAAQAKPKRQKPLSRSRRWADAASDALEALRVLEGGLDDVESALSELRGVQEEYEEWRDNLPENLQSSALGEKLQEVCDLEVEDAASEIRSVIEELMSRMEDAEGMDLPQGFGRD